MIPRGGAPSRALQFILVKRDRIDLQTEISRGRRRAVGEHEGTAAFARRPPERPPQPSRSSRLTNRVTVVTMVTVAPRIGGRDTALNAPLAPRTRRGDRSVRALAQQRTERGLRHL